MTQPNEPTKQVELSAKEVLEEIRPTILAAIVAADRLSRECDRRGLAHAGDQRWLVCAQVPIPLLMVLLDLSLRQYGTAEEVKEFISRKTEVNNG